MRTQIKMVLFAALALGATSLLVVSTQSASGQQAPTNRMYYIAADQVAWNYVPAGRNLIEGRRFRGEENMFVRRAPKQIGRTYLKSVYREYTGADFKQLKSRPADQAYLGLVGPVIHAEVGDTVTIVFRNNTRYDSTIHVHGLFYTKANEGARSSDGTSGADKADDRVRPGQTYTYTLQVPERAGPGPNDPSSIPWIYHSHTNEVRETNAGLVGAIVVTRAGISHPVSAHTLRRTFCTAGLISGVPLRDMQYAMRHADARTTIRYDMARTNLDRHAAHSVAAYLAGMAMG